MGHAETYQGGINVIVGRGSQGKIAREVRSDNSVAGPRKGITIDKLKAYSK